MDWLMVLRLWLALSVAQSIVVSRATTSSRITVLKISCNVGSQNSVNRIELDGPEFED
jgi:hypothetical protein